MEQDVALSKDKKAEVVSQVSQLLKDSKMTVFVQYGGTSVKAMQQLRAKSADSGTVVKVVKNRLFKQAIASHDQFKNVDTSDIKGQLLYAFNTNDEVAPAQDLAAFAKEQPQIEFVGGINADGILMSAADIKVLAALPGKDQLRAQLAGTLAAPLSGFVNVMAGNVRGLLNVLNARSEQA
jgi:large subunit ribosomal protein L10